MRITRIITTACAVALLLSAVPVQAGDWIGAADGPYMSVETVNVKIYHNGEYYDYLGKGYIPMLAKVKEEGLVLDYGVLERVTGDASDGNVIIWWTAASMADMEAAGDRMNEIAPKMRSGEEWQAMQAEMEAIRAPVSTEIVRALTWTKLEEEGAEE